MHNPPHPGEVGVDTTLLKMSLTALAQKLRMSPGAPPHHRGLAERAGIAVISQRAVRGMAFERVAESNRIEGIDREPTAEELVEHDRVMELENLTIRDLEKFVTVYQRNAKLRVNPGMDVRVGSYVPPKGGEHIREMLGALLGDINCERIDAWNAHVQYESIHPFTDGNGRSGRVIYHWQMRSTRMADLGFLHAFYYQTLRNCQTPPKNS